MPETILNQFAETVESAEASGNILSSLGIEWQMLIFQTIGFALVVFLLGKFVFPTFMKQIDERQEKIEAGLKAAHEAEKNAASADAKIEEKLKEAREQAKEIVATAKNEAAQMLEKADERSKAKAETTLEEARAEINREVLAAKQVLHNETLELVALATERVIGKTHSKAADKAVISDSLKEVAR